MSGTQPLDPPSLPCRLCASKMLENQDQELRIELRYSNMECEHVKHEAKCLLLQCLDR